MPGGIGGVVNWRTGSPDEFFLSSTYRVAPGGSFIIYQVTNELRQHATHFESAKSEYFLQNIPPMFITVFGKSNTRNGHNHAGSNGARVPAHQSA